MQEENVQLEVVKVLADRADRHANHPDTFRRLLGKLARQLQRKLREILDLEPAFTVAKIAAYTAPLVSSSPLPESSQELPGMPADLHEIVVIIQRLEAHKEVERSARFRNRQQRFWATLARRARALRKSAGMV
jgi:hypothetical protein